MLSLLRDAGVIGWLILLVGLLLVPASVGIAFTIRDKKLLFAALAMTLLPLGLGVVGTAIGMHMVESRVEASPGQADPREVAEGRRMARTTTWIGLGVSALCFGIVSIGFFLDPRSRRETGSGVQPANEA